MSINLNSDSDDDIFFQGGRPVPTSVYTINHEAPASSDEEEHNPIFDTPAKRPRGRPRKVAPPVQLPRKEKRPKTSVFEISSDDEPTVVHREEPDQHDQTVAAALAHARAVLAEGDEDTLAREADAEITRERALREQEEKERRDAAEEERRRKEAAAEKARNQQQQSQNSAAASADHQTSEEDAIQFQVRMDEARKIRVRIRRTDPLLKILPAFCRKFGLLTKDVVMRVDGDNVEQNDTPQSLDCDDGMQIDVAMRKR